MNSRNHIKRQKSTIFAKNNFEDKYTKDKKYRRVRGHCHLLVNTEVLHIAYII